jgi:mono/diheme cytochrome c family protein
MVRVLLGIVVGVLIVFVGAYFYFAMGYAPVVTKGPEMPFEHWMAHMALHAYLDKQPHPNSPVPADETNMIEGARVYKDNCAVCHGLPGEPKTVIADGMFPDPPQLFRGAGVTDDEPWETYWKVSGGIRMTGMPGFKGKLDDTKMWQVSVLLKNADKISPAVKAELGTTATPSNAAPAPEAKAPAGKNPAPHK